MAPWMGKDVKMGIRRCAQAGGGEETSPATAGERAGGEAKEGPGLEMPGGPRAFPLWGNILKPQLGADFPDWAALPVPSSVHVCLLQK